MGQWEGENQGKGKNMCSARKLMKIEDRVVMRDSEGRRVLEKGEREASVLVGWGDTYSEKKFSTRKLAQPFEDLVNNLV